MWTVQQSFVAVKNHVAGCYFKCWTQLFCQKVFLRILQSSQGNTRIGAFLNEVADLSPATLLALFRMEKMEGGRRNPPTSFSPEHLQM